MKLPSSCSIKARMKGACELSVISPLDLPKHAEANALPRDNGGVRHNAPSIRAIAIRSPRGSTTEIESSTPAESACAKPASITCWASDREMTLIR